MEKCRVKGRDILAGEGETGRGEKRDLMAQKAL
jgi:hypothetical protein